jgi:hypothetical protein
MPSRKELIESAYHEAGHTVIAWYYGRHIIGASVFHDKNKKSNCQILGLLGKFPNIEAHELEREMDIIMAGAAAEEQLTGNKIIGTEWCGTDYQDIVEIAMEWARKTGKALNDEYLIDQTIDVDGIKGCLFSGAFLDEFGGNVRNLMCRSHIWICVEAVANALLKHKNLSEDEVSNIISKTWEKADGGRKEELIEEQIDEEERPWGEWC